MSTQIPEVGSPAFWRLYDDFCKPKHLKLHVSGEQTEINLRIQEIMKKEHHLGTIRVANRPEKNWKFPMAWLGLRNEPVRNDRGEPAFYVRSGDVMVVEHGWDRDVFTTHTPIHEHVCGFILSPSPAWQEMVGLFMPLFDKKTILRCVKLRAEKNVQEAIARAEKQAFEWAWPE